MAATEAFTNGHPMRTPALKREAIRQVIEHGGAVAEVAARIGISRYTLYGWVQRIRITGGSAVSAPAATVRDQDEVCRLRAELQRITEERDRLKMASTHRHAVLGLTSDAALSHSHAR